MDLKSLTNLVEKGVIQCTGKGKTYQVEENLIKPPKQLMNLYALELGEPFTSLLFETEIWRTYVNIPQGAGGNNNNDPDEEEFEDEEEGNFEHTHMSFQFRFKEATIGVVIEYYDDTQKFEATDTVAFVHYGEGNAKKLFQFAGGESTGESTCYHDILMLVIQEKLKLKNVSNTQFVAGLFSRIFSYGPEQSGDKNLRWEDVAEGVLGTEMFYLTRDAVEYMLEHLEKGTKKQKTEGKGLADAIAID